MVDDLKTIQHADDVTLALKNISSLNVAIRTVEEFCKHAGSKVNINKTQCILLGSLKDKYNNISGIDVTNDAVRCLGIYIGHNKNQCYELNWLHSFQNMEKLFESWKKRKLTIFGKACIVNSLAISKIIYVGSILPMPDPEYIKQLKKSIFNFIWNKRDRIKRDTVIGRQEDGGIGVVDIESKFKALKAAWCRILIDKTCIINKIVDSYLRILNVDINYVLNVSETNNSNFEIIVKLPIFYREVFCSFNDCKKTIDINKLSDINFAKQPIWNNILFQFDNKTICHKRWIQSGILYVKDLFNADGQFKTPQELSCILKQKANWMCEYRIVRNAIYKKSLTFDMKCCQYIQKVSNCDFLFINGLHCIEDKKCKFFYENLLFKKFKPPCHQALFKRLFSVGKEYWNDIYKNKVKDIYDKRICEFNYKMLNNTVCCNSFLFKCKYRSSASCNMCSENEDVKHLIFECEHVKMIWSTLSLVIGFDIQWKHVILGFYFERNTKIRYFNTIVSFIAYKIFKYKMCCRSQKKTETYNELVLYLKNNIRYNIDVLVNMSKIQMFKINIVKFADML